MEELEKVERTCRGIGCHHVIEDTETSGVLCPSCQKVALAVGGTIIAIGGLVLAVKILDVVAKRTKK